jgi:hypothetical protein
MSEPTLSPPWTWRDLGAVVLLTSIGVAFILLSLRLLVMIVDLDMSAGMASPISYIAAVVIYGLVVLGIYLFAARRNGWATLGIRAASWQAYVVTPLFVFVAFVGMAAMSIIIMLLRGEPVENPQVQALTGGQPFTALTFVMLFVLVAVLVPIAEELFFRGMLYPLLRQHWGATGAVIISAWIFAAAHFILILFPSFLLVGLLLGLLREKSGSLLPCILFHAIQNSIVLMLVSGQLSEMSTPASLITQWW